MEKFEHIKDLLGKQKEFSGKLNECIKTSLANIIATKTNYKNELIKMQDNIKYDIINNGNGDQKNFMEQINNISSSINDFKNKIDSSSNIYLKTNSNNNNMNFEKKIDDENENPNNINKIQNKTGENKFKRIFQEVNGCGFKF